MNSPAANPYLRTHVLTASSEQLRMLLYEGALKFCHQGKAGIENQDFEKTYENLSRAQSILLELTTSLNHDEDPELCDRLSSLYIYMYRRLIDASMTQDVPAVEEVIKLLNYERETWQMVLDRAAEEQQGGTAAHEPPTSTATRVPTPSPAAAYGQPGAQPTSRISHSA